MSAPEPREIRVIKVPREKPLASWPAAFKDLDVNSLGLEHMEIKSKVKLNPPTLRSVLPNPTPKPAPAPKKPSPKAEPRPPPKPILKKASTTEDEIAKAFAAESREVSEVDDLEDDEAEAESIGDIDDNDSDDSGDDVDPVVEDLEDLEDLEDDDSEVLAIELSSDKENDEITDALKEPEAVVVAAEPEETEREKKRRILRRLRTLKKINPEFNIPGDFDENDDLELMQSTLDDIVYDLKLDQSLAIYRTVLQGYFGGVELLAGFLDYDMVGFAGHQMKMMRRYDSLLMELAEKNSGGWASNLPIELRLLGMVLINTAVYFLFRYIFNKKGAPQAHAFMGVVDALPSFDAKPAAAVGAATPGETPAAPTPPRTFRGPSVNLKDIEKEIGSTSDSESEEEDDWPKGRLPQVAETEGKARQLKI